MSENGRGFQEDGKVAWLNHLPGMMSGSDELWKEALASANIVSFPADTKLIQCGDDADKFVIVLQGVVKVYETAENGREICLYRVYGGQVCVLTLTKLLMKSSQCAEAVAEEDVRLLVMPQEYYHLLMARSESFRNYLLTSMAHCIDEVMQLVAQVSFQRLDLRLACLIGQLSQQKSTNRLVLTHQDIANELGTTCEVISRLLKEFENMGCVKLSRGKIEVLSGSALERLSG